MSREITIAEALEVLDRAGLVKTCFIASEIDRRLLSAMPDPLRVVEHKREDMAMEIGRKLLERGLLRIEANDDNRNYTTMLRASLSLIVPGRTL